MTYHYFSVYCGKNTTKIYLKDIKTYHTYIVLREAVIECIHTVYHASKHRARRVHSLTHLLFAASCILKPAIPPGLTWLGLLLILSTIPVKSTWHVLSRIFKVLFKTALRFFVLLFFISFYCRQTVWFSWCCLKRYCSDGDDCRFQLLIGKYTKENSIW